jgi:hypothetical protein
MEADVGQYLPKSRIDRRDPGRVTRFGERSFNAGKQAAPAR